MRPDAEIPEAAFPLLRLDTNMAPQPVACFINTTDTASSTLYRLRSLQPVELKPTWRSETPNITSPLLRIDRLQVVKLATNKEATYAVHGFYKQPQTRIPTSTRKAPLRPPSASRQTPARMPQPLSVHPDFTMPHASSDFGLLRDHLHTCAQTGHRGSMCAFCQQLADYCSIGGGRPLAFASAMLDPKGDASQMLTAFLNQVLGLCQTLLEHGRQESCRGQRHIPYLLHEFLFQRSEDQ